MLLSRPSKHFKALVDDFTQARPSSWGPTPKLENGSKTLEPSSIFKQKPFQLKTFEILKPFFDAPPQKKEKLLESLIFRAANGQVSGSF